MSCKSCCSLRLYGYDLVGDLSGGHESESRRIASVFDSTAAKCTTKGACSDPTSNFEPSLHHVEHSRDNQVIYRSLRRVRGRQSPAWVDLTTRRITDPYGSKPTRRAALPVIRTLLHQVRVEGTCYQGCYSCLRTRMRRGLDARKNSAAVDLLLCCFEHSFLVFPLFLREIDKLEVTSERPRLQMSLVLMRALESSPLKA